MEIELSYKEIKIMKITQNKLLAIVLFILLNLVAVELIDHRSFATYDGSVLHEVEAQVVAIQTSDMEAEGLAARRTQYLTVKIAAGEFKGVKFNATYNAPALGNWGQELDVQDTILVDLILDDYGEVTGVRILD